MILKKIESVGKWQFVLELHPRITVITGLPPEKRGRLAAMITSVVRGDLSGLYAQIDFEGRLQDLTTQLANDLELFSTPTDVLLREQDLPGAVVVQEFGRTGPPDAESGLTDDEIRAEAMTEFPEPVFVEPEASASDSATTDGDSSGLNPVDPSMLAPHQLNAAVYVSDLRGPLRTSWIAMERARQERDATAEELDKAQGRDGSAPQISTDQLRRDVTQAQMVLHDAERSVRDGGDIGEVIASRENDLAVAQQQREQVKTALETFEARPALPVVDTQGVQRAFSSVLAERDSAAQNRSGPSPRARKLIDSLESVEQRLREHVPKNAPSWLVAQTREQLEEAHQRVVIAESEYKMAAADSTDVQAVEQAHNEVQELEDSGGKIFGGNRKAAIDAALAKENAALDRIGLPNYDSFRLQLGSLGRDRGVVEEMLSRARASLSDAEQMWEELQSPTDDPDLQSLLAERNNVVAEARFLVGNVDDRELLTYLQNFREETDDVGVLEAELWRQLALVDVPKVDVDVIVIAEAWLAERSGDLQAGLEREETRATMRDAVVFADARIGEVQSELAELRSRASTISSPAELEAHVNNARAAYEKAEHMLSMAEQEERARSQSESELTSLRQTLAAAQTVYEKARGIFLEGLAQIRANDSANAQNMNLDERGLARIQFEGERAAVAADRERWISERIAERDNAVIKSMTGSRWDAPFYMAPTVDIRHCDQEDIEVFVLSRLSSLRNIGQAGSVPLVVDDAFRAFGPEAIGGYLELLQRVSRVMQLVYLTEDVRIETWAATLGADSAAIVRMS